MDFTTFILMVTIFFIGSIHGWGLRERVAKKRLEQFTEFIENREEDEETNMIRITIEEHAGVLFVYNKENNSFMAQGKNREEVEKALNDRYPNKRFACDHDTLVKLGFVS